MNEVAERADVVEVTVREHMRFYLVLVLLEVGDVRGDVVDARVVRTWEQEAHVNDNNLVVILDGVHIFADTHLADTTDRDDAQFWCPTPLLAWLHLQAELLAAIAVIDRFVYWNVDNVLTGTQADVL